MIAFIICFCTASVEDIYLFYNKLIIVNKLFTVRFNFELSSFIISSSYFWSLWSSSVVNDYRVRSSK